MTEEKTATEVTTEEVVKEEAETKVAVEKEAVENQTPEQKQNAYFKRKADEAEKLKLRAKELEEELAMFKKGGDDEGIDAKIAKRFEIETTVSNLISKFPDLEEDREKILRYAHDPSRSGLPLDEVISGAIGFDKMIKVGAKIKAQVEDDANLSKFGGNDIMTAKEKTKIDEKRDEYTAKFENLPFIKNAKKSLNL